MKHLKTYEYFNHNMLTQLVEQFDESFIDEYFEENYMRTAEEIISLWPNTIFRFVDDDKYIEDLIDNEINSYSIEDYGEYDYRDYLQNNITDEQEEKVLKKFNKKIKNKEDKADYYDSDMLEDLSEKQLRNIIESEDKEEDFIEYVIRDRYEDRTVEDIVGEWINLDDGDELYKHLSYYIDDKDEEEIVDSWLSEQDKEGEIQENIPYDRFLQEKLLEIDTSNALLLAEVFKNYPTDNLSNEYDFQKMYITEYVKRNNQNESHSRAEAVKFIMDNFDINEDIKEEYSDDMWLSKSIDYNL